jgi:hypothetical protein
LILQIFSPIGICQEPKIPAEVGLIIEPNLVFTETAQYIHVKYWQFQIRIYKGSNGLVQFYTNNGTLFLQDDYVLQYFASNKWNNLSAPRSLTWQMINKTAMTVTKGYVTPISGTRLGMNITFLIVSCRPVKFSLKINLPSNYNLRFRWSPTVKKQTFYSIASRNVIVGSNSTGLDPTVVWMRIDWGDIIDTKGSIVSVSVARIAEDLRAQIYLAIGALARNTNYLLDPSYIGDSTNAFATGDPYSRKYWFSNTKMYIWISNGTHLGWYYNTSLTAWSSFNSVRACENGQHFGVAMNSSHVAYAYANTSALSKVLYWRMGSVASGGSISWLGTGEYKVNNNTTPYAIGAWPVPFLSGDKGWPYIGFTHVQTTARVNLTRSLYSNGTWAKDWSREISSGTYSGRYVGGCVRGSTADIRLYWLNSTEFWTILYNRTADAFQQRQRIDSTQTATVSTYGMMWSSASDDNYCTVAWLGRRTGLPANYSLCFDFKSSSRDFNVTDEWIQILNGTLSCPSLSIDSSGQKIYAFFWHKPTAGHLYYRSRDLTVKYMPLSVYANYWTGSSTDWFTDTPQSYARQQTIEKKQGSFIYYCYMNETSSPYHLKWANLSIAVSRTSHLVNTWTFTIITRSTKAVANWLFTILTRQSNLVQTWAFTILTRDTRSVAAWAFTIITRQPILAAQWAFLIVTHGLHLVGWWTFTLLPWAEPFPFIWIVGFAMIAGLFGLVFIRRRKKEEDEKVI